MRGKTLFVGNLLGLTPGIEFSDGTVQKTAYQGTSDNGGTFPNQITITNSTNSTELVISAGQDSNGDLIDDNIYYTALNSTETLPTLTHNFEGSTVNLNTTLNVAGATALDSTLTVLGTAQLNSALTVDGLTTINNELNVGGQTTLEATQIYNTLNVDGLTTINNSANVYQLLNVSGGTTLESTLTVYGGTTLDSTLNVLGATELQSTLTVDGAASFGGQNTFTNTNTFNGEIVLTNSNNTTILNEGNTTLNGTLAVAGTSTFTSGFACGNQTSPYIMLIGTASVAYGGNALDSYASDSQNTNVVSVCTFNNSVSFPTSIVGGYVNTNYQYIWASFVSGVSGTTNQINVSFVNLGQAEDYFPSTITFLCWGN